MNLLEENIFKQFRNGNENAFEFIFKTYYGHLHNYARQILKDPDAAEEAVEMTFLNFWENRMNIALSSSIKSYLFKSVYNNCLNHIKHLHVKERYVLYFKYHATTDNAGNLISDDYPLSRVIENELETLIQKALDNLPPQCREIFLLSRHESLANDEIAEKLNISINTVRTQISRALAKLRKSLKEFLSLILFELIINIF
jgi:RNA polymerase sigma-70 factor (ECF subfamily)